MWKTIRSCIPKKSASTRTFEEDDKAVANKFNQYFTSVGKTTIEKTTELAKQWDYTYKEQIPTESPVSPFPPSEQFNFHDVSCGEVKRVVTSIPNNKAPGIDKIPSRVIKEAAPVIIPQVTSVIDSSFKTSVFPSAWKTAEVLPILKEGDHEEACNNRPISLLPILSKVCEKVALNQLTPYLISKQRLAINQSGNKKWHSTETSLLTSTDSILRAIDQKKVTAVAYLDMSKAFDSINHCILLNKLTKIGLSETAVAWFRSYLSQRTQVVRINSTLSDVQPVESGVPQGSVLAALLFSIYVNDLPSVCKDCSSECYVDDTKLLISFLVTESDSIEQKINADLTRIRNWCFENYLLLNPDKTKLVIYGSRQMLRKMPSFSLTMLGKDLKPSDVVKDLGVIFDPSLSFDAHITSLVSSCFSKLGQISRAKHAFNKELLIAIINALVFSKLYYCSSVWSSTTNKNIEKLQLVQNFAARICCGVRKFDHITPALKDLRWMPVKQQLYLRDATLTFKCMAGCVPEYLTKLFTTREQTSGRSTRNCQKLQIPLFKTSTGQKSFIFRAVTIWNNLPQSLKLSMNFKDFKRKLRNTLLKSFLE